MKINKFITSPYGKDCISQVQTKLLLDNLSNISTSNRLSDINDIRYYNNKVTYQIERFIPNTDLFNDNTTKVLHNIIIKGINGLKIELKDINTVNNIYDNQNILIDSLTNINNISPITIVIKNNPSSEENSVITLSENSFQSKRITKINYTTNYHLALNNRVESNNIKFKYTLQNIKKSDTGSLNIKIGFK